MTAAAVRLAADIGGTFTDLVLETAGRHYSAKLLTTPRAPEQGVLRGIEAILGEAGLGPEAVSLLVHGTTLATNALIERKGAVTALLTTRGFRDVLATGYEKRFDQNSVFLQLPEPLVPRARRFTVAERLSARGEVLLALDRAALQNELPEQLQAAGVGSLAIGFLHAYAYPDHEQGARELLQTALPELHISLSSEVCPEMREYERLSTTCANAYVQPLMAGYLRRLQEALSARGFSCPLLLMTSGGGLTTLELAARFPVRLVESGPAGGALLAGHVAAELGLNKVLSFDMGGTTAKICLLENAVPERSRRFEVARVYRHMKGSGLPLRIPVIELVEIGAGGGSLAQVDDLGRVGVGPDSAGSEPGPACYDRGGERPTVTDANLVLGRLDPDDFAGGSIALNPAKAEAALARDVGRPGGLDGVWAAAAVIEIVDENMANAARVHAIERGKNVAEQTLIAFGGAAPLHVARLAEKLDIDRVVVPPGAGVGSAIGFLRAPVAFEVVRSGRFILDDAPLARINRLLAAMHAEAEAVVRIEAIASAELDQQRQVDVRYLGQGHELTLTLPNRPLVEADRTALQTEFEHRYRAQYGLLIPGQALELVAWSLRLSGAAAAAPPAPVLPGVAPQPGRLTLTDPQTGRPVIARVYRRAELSAGFGDSGPLLVTEPETTTWVPAGFRVSVERRGYLILTRGAQRRRGVSAAAAVAGAGKKNLI